MKTQTILLALALTLPLTVPASAHPSGGKNAARVIEALDLDDGRTEEVRQIMQSFQKKNRALRQEVRQEMKALRNEQREQLQRVLTEEEMAKLNERRSAKRKNHKKDCRSQDHHQFHKQQ